MVYMTSYITLSLIGLPILVALDMLWLLVIAQKYYKGHLGHLMGDVVVLQPAILFYILYTLGVTYFVTMPQVEASLPRVALVGAAFGFIAYATYDLTNHATLKNWPLEITVIDMVWGALLTASVTTMTVFIYRTFIV